MISSLGRTFVAYAAAAMLATLAVLAACGWVAARLIAGPQPVRFANSFFEFRLPHGWTCIREQTEQVCSDGAVPRKAIIIFTMKERGPQDTLAQYLAHLRTPRTLRVDAAGRQVRDGQPAAREQPSELVRAGRLSLGAHDWVEGLHLGSEVLYYYTHYYATLTADIALLITFSAHQRHYDEYRADIETLVRSLVIYQTAATSGRS